MEERKHILDYGAQVLMIWGFAMLCMLLFICLFGEAGKEISNLFTLGREGISVAVMLEFLLLSIVIVGLRYFFFTDRFLKKPTVMIRTFGMIFSILIVISGFIFLFGWFPVTMWQPWVMFFLCFLICFIGSMLVSTWKNSQENKKLEAGLARLKAQWEEENES